MTCDLVEVLGLFAGACTVTAFVPQVILVWRTKSVKDLSLGMYFLTVVGVTAWLAYGLLIDSLAVVVSNVCALILTSTIFILKLKYRKN